MSFTTSNVSAGQTISGFVVSATDTENVLAGGTAVSTLVEPAGTLQDYGTLSGVTVTGGKLEILSGGTASNVNLTPGGFANWGNLFAFSGTVNNLTIGDFDTASFSNGTTGTFVTVSSGGVLGVNSGAVLDHVTVLSGGTLDLQGGTVSNLVSSAGAVVFSSIVASGARVTGTVLTSGLDQIISSGGVAISTTISSGGVQRDYGTTDDVTIVRGQLSVYGGGVAHNVTVTSYGLIEDLGSMTDVTLLGNAQVVVLGGVISNVTVDSGGALDNGGTVSGTVVIASGGDNYVTGHETGVTVANGGFVVVSAGGNVDNITVLSGGTLGIGSGSVSAADVLAGGQLIVSSGGTATGTILASGGVIDLANLAYVSGGTANLTSATDALQITEGANSVTLQLGGNYTGEYFHLTPDGSSGTDITVNDIPCYCRGTRILTDRGESPIEDLKIGDRLITASGKARKLRWIGRRGYHGRFIVGNRDILPILLTAGSLADAVPSRDLYVSPLHAMYLDGVLIPAWVLVNGTSIRQVPSVETVEYFHLELATHDVILAEGAMAETFLDEGGRGIFQNAPQYAALYPNGSKKSARPHAPRMEAGSIVDGVRARILARALTAGHPPAATIPRPTRGVISRLILAGAAVIPIDRQHLISIVLDGETLDPKSQHWISDKLLAIDPSSMDRWCHAEIALKQSKLRA